MAISKLTGQMLSNVLVRDGQGLAFTDTANSTPLLYIDVANSRIGVNTSSPTTALTIDGTGFANSFNLTNSLSLGGNVVADGDIGANNLSATANIAAVNLSASGNVNSINVSASGNINSVNVSATGNINSVNMTATGNMDAVNVSASGNINSVNVSASGNINATANVYSNNASITSNIATANLSVTGTASINSLNVVNMSITGNITGNVTTSTTGNITAGNIDTGNITAGNISVTGQAVLGNITLNDTTFSSLGNIIVFAGTNGVAVPVGNTGQRPTTPPAGTVRFNTENNDLETWSGAEWVNTSAQFTQILDQQITGDDGITYALDYPTDDNNSIIVSINGITQLPGTAYNVVGTDIVFASALLTSEVADIRYLTYPVPVGEYGNSNVAAYLATNTGNVAGSNILSDNYLYANGTPISFSGGSYANSNVVAYGEAGWAGNIIPSANVTYSLGNSTRQWKDLWVSNNTIYINSVPISVSPGNILTVGGDSVITANSSTTGNIITTGNVTADYFVGNGSLLTNLPASNSISNSGNSFTMSPSGVLSLAEGVDSYLTLDRFGITAVTQMTIQSTNTVTGNNSAILFDRNGGGIAFRMEDVVANVPAAYNWGFYHSNVLFPDSTRQYTAYPGTANALTLTGNVSASYFVGNGSLLTGITSSANTGNIGFVGDAIYDSNGIYLENANLTAAATAALLLPANGNTDNIQLNNTEGNIVLQAGTGDALTAAWLFDSTGNLTLAADGNLNLNRSSIAQLQNNNLTISVQDQDNDDWSLNNIVTDGAGDTLSYTRLRRNNFDVITNALGTPHTWSFDNFGVLNLPGNINGAYASNTSVYAVNDGTTGSIELKTISFAGDALLSNLRVGNDSVTISTASAAYNWTFDNNGQTTMPDGTRIGNIEGANTFGFYNSNNDTQFLFETNSNYWQFNGNTSNLESSGGISVVGNITGNYILGNGSLLTGITGGSANTGNVTFNDQIILGTGSNDGGGGLYLAPGNASIANSAVQYLRVRGGDFPTHIHFDTGNNAYYDQYFGADNKFVKLEANGNVVINADDSGANSATWTFDTTGVVALPTISLGAGVDEQTTIQSQRKIIPPYRWSAEIANTTPTVVYTATSVNTTSMKVTIQVQHQGLGFEFFEVFATYTGSTDTYYVVNNRVAPPTIAPTTAEVSLTGSNVMEIILTVNSGAAASWVTYDAVEFGIPND